MASFLLGVWVTSIVVAIATYAEDFEYEISWRNMAVVAVFAPIYLAAREVFKRYPGGWI